MKKKLGIIIGIGAAILTLLVLALIIVIRGRFTASTMRIDDISGKVTLTDSKGREEEPEIGRRLVDGNELETYEESSAMVLLDEDRFVYLLELSDALVNRKGRSVRLTLDKGSTFFFIDKELSDDESFEISTSTMVIGIRGTSGYVDVRGGKEVLYLTSGKVTVTITETGEEYDIEAGQKISVYEDEDGKLIVTVEEFDSIPSEALEIIRSNDDLMDEVKDSLGSEIFSVASLPQTETVPEPETVVNGRLIYPEVESDGRILHQAYYEFDYDKQFTVDLDQLISLFETRDADLIRTTIGIREEYWDLVSRIYEGILTYKDVQPGSEAGNNIWYSGYKISLWAYTSRGDNPTDIVQIAIIPEEGTGYFYRSLYFYNIGRWEAQVVFCECHDATFMGSFTQVGFHSAYTDGTDEVDHIVYTEGTVKDGLLDGTIRVDQGDSWIECWLCEDGFRVEYWAENTVTGEVGEKNIIQEDYPASFWGMPDISFFY